MTTIRIPLPPTGHQSTHPRALRVERAWFLSLSPQDRAAWRQECQAFRKSPAGERGYWEAVERSLEGAFRA